MYSPDGRKLAAAGGGIEGRLRVWDTGTWREAFAFDGKTGFRDLAFSPDARFIAIPNTGGKGLEIVNARTGQKVSGLTGHKGSTIRLAYHPNGKLLASLGSIAEGKDLKSMKWSHDIKAWDISTGREVFSIAEPGGGAWGFAFSPDGKWLASTVGENVYDASGNRWVSGSGEVLFWESMTGKRAVTFRAHDRPIKCPSFSPNGTRLASASEDQTVKVWDLPMILGRPVEALPQGKGKPGEPNEEMEREASRKLKLAKMFADDAAKALKDGNKRGHEELVSQARNRYQEIVDKYPKTKAAEEAKRRLEELEK